MLKPVSVLEPAPEPGQLLTKKQLASMFQVTPRQISNLPIPFVRVGGLRRYEPNDVAAYIEKRKGAGR